MAATGLTCDEIISDPDTMSGTSQIAVFQAPGNVP